MRCLPKEKVRMWLKVVTQVHVWWTFAFVRSHLNAVPSKCGKLEYASKMQRNHMFDKLLHFVSVYGVLDMKMGTFWWTATDCESPPSNNVFIGNCEPRIIYLLLHISQSTGLLAKKGSAGRAEPLKLITQSQGYKGSKLGTGKNQKNI